MDGGGGGGGYRQGGGGGGGGRNNNYGGGGGGHHHQGNKRKFDGGQQQQHYSQQRRDADEGGDGTRPLLAKLIKCADVPRVSFWRRERRKYDHFAGAIVRRFLSAPTFSSLSHLSLFHQTKPNNQQPQGSAPPAEEILAVAKELRRELNTKREDTVREREVLKGFFFFASLSHSLSLSLFSLSPSSSLSLSIFSLTFLLLSLSPPPPPKQLRRFLLDCGTEIAYKAPVYATLAGALNAMEPRFGALLAEDARAAVEAAASSAAPGDRHRLRLSVRWVACLATTGVVSAGSAAALLRSLVDAAMAVADANSSEKSANRKRHPREWQPYSDDLVYCALSALPWCGRELNASVPGELETLVEAARAYASRPERRAFSPGLAPYFASSDSSSASADFGAAAAFASCDAGGASFLTEVLKATDSEMSKGREQAWSLPSVPWPSAASRALEELLASGTQAPHELSGPVAIPVVPPVLASLGLGGGEGGEGGGNDPSSSSSSSSSAVRGAALLSAYPPRGRLDLLPRLAPDGNPPPGALEGDPNWRPAHSLSGWALLAAEDAVADTARAFDGDRVQCARRLALALPHIPLASAAFDIEVGSGESGMEGNEAEGGKKRTISVAPVAGAEALLAETLLAAMVRPPAPDLKPLAYSALLVDCCRALPTAFPRAMSGCVRELFARCGQLDPYVSRAVADWLAYHLSNFEFAWPWAKWQGAVLPLEVVPAHAPKRRFVARLIDDLVRLSYWERVGSALPESFHALMPPRPAVAPLEEEEVEGEMGAEGEESEASLFSLDAAAAREVLDLARRKAPPSALTEWAAGAIGQRQQLQGPKLVVSALRALLVAGSKSFTHMVTVLERYHDFLSPLISTSCASAEQGEMAALKAVEQAWKAAPQRGAQAVDRLMAARLVSGASVVRWALSSKGFLSLAPSPSSAADGNSDLAAAAASASAAQTLAWDALHVALDKLAARAADAAADAAGAKGAAVDAAEAADAAEEAAAVAAAAENEAAEGATPPPSENTSAAAALRATAAAALELADVKAQEHAGALETQREALALALTMMRDALADADNAVAASSASSSAEGDPTGERAAWRAHTLATLRAFVRRYHAAVAPIAEAVVRGRIFAEGGPAPADARAAVLISLEM